MIKSYSSSLFLPRLATFSIIKKFVIFICKCNIMKNKKATFTIPELTLVDFEKYAKDNFINKSKVVSSLISEFLNNKKKE